MKKLAIGLMSGTSLDGIDAVLVEIEGSYLTTKVKQIDFLTLPYNTEERTALARLVQGTEGGSKELLMMDVLLGQKFAQAATALCDHCHVDRHSIDFIGSAGHTFYHLPEAEPYLGEMVRGTFQLGEPSFLNEAFDCPVVSDFRVRDMAAGGQGAPLVPYTEFILYRSEHENIALQNIGGIGNITILKAGCNPDEVIAFDTGPGNMVIDELVFCYSQGKQTYDKDGTWGKKGKVNEQLFASLCDDDYLTRPLPKTTGRERYGNHYVSKLLRKAETWRIPPYDAIATVTYFTAFCIAEGLRSASPDLVMDKLIVGGGGCHNPNILGYLEALLPNTQILTNEEIGYDSDAKEAVAFALLANETLQHACNNLPSVTYAQHPAILGKISY
ncbi:MAG: anhydro-N-acetylmuramic acid kinase [Spirochaetia bacterium]|jgi:anhydro-N-acetylmuramic acid kinase|nr:anhydro-N-acetylmuramic acid kinase [Spirochaetia bacterium]